MSVLSVVVSVVLLVIGLLVGCALGWFVRASRFPHIPPRAGAHSNQSGVPAPQVPPQLDPARFVTPLRESLESLTRHVDDAEHRNTAAFSSLSQQMTTISRTTSLLSNNTHALVSALRAPAVRGRWGETQLERVVELAGMTHHCDFSTQRTSADGSARPDLVVHLSGGRNIIVDAKAPLMAYLDASEETDTMARNELIAQHAKQIRSHVNELADKAYWAKFQPTPEFVVMFVPADPILDAALAVDLDLLDYAFSKNVVLATPTTLIALLRTVSLTWRQDALASEARKIQQLGSELYARISTVADHLNRLGTSLEKSVDAFNSSVASLDSRVMVTARRLAEMESVSSPGRYAGEEVWVQPVHPHLRQAKT